MKCHPKGTTSVRQVFDIDAKLTPIDDVVQLTETALDRIQKAFGGTVFARIPYVCFIALLSFVRKISGLDIKILKAYSDDFCHQVTEKAATMAALDGEIADRDEQKIKAGFVLLFRAAEVMFSLESDSEQLHECEPGSMKSTIIAMNEQSHKGPRAQDDHCILYMMESDTNDTLVALKALHRITYIELRQNYLVQRTMASELKNVNLPTDVLQR